VWPPLGSSDRAQARAEDRVYYAKRLRGASNEKARHELNFRPRPLEWLQGRAVTTQHG
jgi:hypothetical protein